MSLSRGGLLPQADIYPAAMRATRDPIRRRPRLVQKRGHPLAHIQDTRAQYNLPAFGRRLAYPANWNGVHEHFPDANVRKSIDVDLTLAAQDDTLITDLELTIVREANGTTLTRSTVCDPVPGIAKSQRSRSSPNFTASRAPTASRNSPRTPDS